MSHTKFLFKDTIEVITDPAARAQPPTGYCQQQSVVSTEAPYGSFCIPMGLTSRWEALRCCWLPSYMP